MSALAQPLEIGRRVVMTPQLQQAMRLLRLSALELQSQLQHALESNVMLETDEAFDSTWVLDTSGPNSELPQSPAAEGSGGPAPESSRTLREHLASQLELAPLPNGPRIIARALIEAINDDGYLTATPEAIAASVAGDVRASADVIESVLAIIQQFDPAGVGARSDAECIDLQLAQLAPATLGRDAARKIARHYLEMVQGGQYHDLERLAGCSGAELEAALALVRGCHPRPGAAFRASRAEYAVPDVFARRAPDGWSVELNPAAAPRLRVSERYAGMVTRSADQAALRTQLQEARWLVGGIEIRNETLLRVARLIVNRQADFFDRSEASVKPMTLRSLAAALDIHESTVARIAAGKYLQTPRGVFEFRFFCQ